MDCPLAIVVNANADRGAFVRKHMDALRGRRRPGERIYVSHSADELERICAEISTGQPDAVALVGGDGTLTLTLTALFRASGGLLPRRLVLLRGGTMNTVANGLGVAKGSPLQLLDRYRQWVADGGEERSARRFYTLAVDGRIGFLFSAGMMYAFLAEYYTGALGTGPLGAGALLASGIGSALVRGPLAARLADRLSAELRVDDRVMPGRDFLFVGAGTVPQVGLGFRPYSKVADAPAGFHVLAYGGRIRSLVWQLPRFARGAGRTVDGTVDVLARSLCIDAGEQPVPYSLDGELFESPGPLRLQLGPQVTVW